MQNILNFILRVTEKAFDSIAQASNQFCCFQFYLPPFRRKARRHWFRDSGFSLTGGILCCRFFWNFAGFFYMVWRCEWSLTITLILIFIAFLLWTVIFGSIIYIGCAQLFLQFFTDYFETLALFLLFLHGLRMCIWSDIILKLIFVTIFALFSGCVLYSINSMGVLFAQRRP